MNFMSDNAAGAAPEILTALEKANNGTAASYGGDEVTTRVTSKLSEIFEKTVAVFPVATGTAANSLSLATITPHYGAVICHEGSHIHVDECGAPEFFSSGAKLVPVKGRNGKLTPYAVSQALAHFQRGFVHHPQPAAISLTQSTELGTCYSAAELQTLSKLARAEKLKLHMDGARFSNAVAHLRCKPADITWRAGVDVLSLGMTKNGAMAAEAVVFFNPGDAADLAFRRKRSGHLFSKMRFLSAQLDAMLTDGLWLRLASHANEMAARLAAGLKKIEGVSIECPVEANEVFARLRNEDHRRQLESAGAKFYLWEPVGTDGRPLIRLVCSFKSSTDEVDRFIRAAGA